MESDRGVSSAARRPATVLVIGSLECAQDESVGGGRVSVIEASPDDALDRLTDDADTLDGVVVTDGHGDDCLAIIEAVRRAAPTLPIVVAVAPTALPAERALEAGACEVIRPGEDGGGNEGLEAHFLPYTATTASPGRDRGALVGLGRLARRAIAGAAVPDLMADAVALLDVITDGSYTAVHVVDAAQSTTVLRWGCGWPPDVVDTDPAPLDDRSPVGRSVAEGRSVIVEDCGSDPRFDRPGAPVDDIVGASTALIGPPADPFGVLGAYRAAEDGPLGDTAGYVAVVATILTAVVDRRERETDLERYERIVETIDDGIYTLDDEFRITWVNQAASAMLGYPRDELVGSHALKLTSEETLDQAARISQELLSGERDVGRLDTELRTADGERVPIETQFTMLSLGDGRYGQVGVFRDITDRKEYERVLTALHDSTRDLVRAESATEVGRIIRATAAELLDLATVVYRFDDEANLLRPSVSAEAADRAFGDLGPIGPRDESPVWRAFVEQERILGEPAEGAEAGYFPLGSHGVLAATAEGADGFDIETRRLTSLLAANTEAALDRIAREEELRERERERQRQTRRLEELNRVNEIIRGIDQTLVKAETREEIEQAVCEQLVRDDRFAFAWIGASPPGNDEVAARAWAGDETGYLDQVSITATTDAAEPTGRAAVERETVVVSNVSEGFRDETWRSAALSSDYLAVLSVPLAYGDLFYGVLTVYADEPAAFDAISEDVFGELGSTIAYAINSLETKQSLLTDRSVELDLRLDAEDDLLCRMSRAAGYRLEYQEFLSRSGRGSTVVFTAPAEAVGDVIDLADHLVAVDQVKHVTDRDGTAVFEATIDASTVATTIKEYGAVLRSIVADEHESRAIVELPSNADIRVFVETLQRTIPEVELVARRDRDRSIESREAFQTDLESTLTDRQLEVLRAAYRNGYFEWPRQQTGEEVAAGLGISQPTFNRHLRESERKLFTLLLEDRR